MSAKPKVDVKEYLILAAAILLILLGLFYANRREKSLPPELSPSEEAATPLPAEVPTAPPAESPETPPVLPPEDIYQQVRPGDTLNF